jgi:hypothetical protein
MTEMIEKDEIKDERTALNLALLETLFGEVPRYEQALKYGPWDVVNDSHAKLVDSWMTVCDITHRLSNLDDERAIPLMLLESHATHRILKLKNYNKMSAAAGMGSNSTGGAYAA